jgi:hypothetical protein
MGYRRAVLAVVLASVGVGALTLWRSRSLDAREDAEYAAALATHRATVRSLPMSVPADADAIATSLRAATVGGRAVVSADQCERLLRTAADFLDLKFRAVGPGEYAAWRSRTGARLKSPEAVRRWFPDLDTQRRGWFAPDLPDDAPIGDVWTAFWNASEARDGPGTRPVRWADTPDALAVSFGWFTPASPVWPDPPSTPGRVLEFFGGAHTRHSWWTHADALENQVARDGRALTGIVRVVLEFADGRRRTAGIGFVWSPRSSAWILESVSLSGESPIVWNY